MKKDVLKLIELLGGVITYDGWDEKGFINVDFPLYYTVHEVGIDFDDDEEQTTRVSIHNSVTSMSGVAKQITQELMKAGEKKFKLDYKALMAR